MSPSRPRRVDFSEHYPEQFSWYSSITYQEAFNFPCLVLSWILLSVIRPVLCSAAAGAAATAAGTWTCTFAARVQ